jgi:uncharacterized protein (TIGR02266 family)
MIRSILIRGVTGKPDDVVRVRLRYPDLDTFVDKFAPNVTRGGIFLASRDPRPVGDKIRFEVLLREGPPVLVGEGRVTWVKEFNAAEPHRPYGMGVQFTAVDKASRPVLDRLLRQRDQSGARPLPKPPTQPVRPVSVPAGRDEARPTDRDVSLEGLDQIEDTAVRRLLDRARTLSARTDDLEALLAPEQEESVSLSQALDDLPRVLSSGRRPTGVFRVIGDEPPATDPATPGEKKT